jgi:hypothetical protein
LLEGEGFEPSVPGITDLFRDHRRSTSPGLARGYRESERIIEAAESTGADNVQISLNRGVLPHEMCIEQIRRFARDVLPKLPGTPGRARAAGGRGAGLDPLPSG